MSFREIIRERERKRKRETDRQTEIEEDWNRQQCFVNHISSNKQTKKKNG